MKKSDKNIIRCKHCGASLPINADFCDVCGQKVERQTYRQKASQDAQKRLQTKKRLKVFVPIVLLCIIFVGYKIWDAFWFKNIILNPNYQYMLTKVSVEEYKKINVGMTYKEACKTIGGKGKLRLIAGYAKEGAKGYIWPGEFIEKDNMDSSFDVMVDNSTKKIIMIRERNLVDGAEVLENIKAEKESHYIQRNKIEKGMTRNEVVELLGSDGVLDNSSSIKDGSGEVVRKRYKWVGGTSHEIEVEFENDIVQDVYEYGY